MFRVEKDGFFGEYYEPTEKRFPGKAMVVCTGSDGSFLLARLGAEKFCEAGMPVIALAYWNTEGTPQDDCLIPVEYLQRACRWLKEEKGLHPGVWGISLGGTYVLLCGSLLPEVECVVAASPVHVLFNSGSFTGGLHFAKGAPFTLAGRELPYIGVGEDEKKAFVKKTWRSFFRNREPNMLFYYEDILNRPHDPEAEIKVEDIRGPILLLSGGQDVMVPANRVCGEVVKRLEAKRFPYPYAHYNYDVLSHYVCPIRPMSSGIFLVERKHRAECDANRARCWQDTLDFLRKTWQV